jgi:hypothetical protein
MADQNMGWIMAKAVPLLPVARATRALPHRWLETSRPGLLSQQAAGLTAQRLIYYRLTINQVVLPVAFLLALEYRPRLFVQKPKVYLYAQITG